MRLISSVIFAYHKQGSNGNDNKFYLHEMIFCCKGIFDEKHENKHKYF